METLTHYLDQILEWHTKLSSPLSKYLQPGLSVDEIRRKIAVLPFKMPEEFIELYVWRNGTPARNRDWVSLIEFHRFLSLEEAIETFQDSYPIMKEFYEKTDWIMTFEDGSGDGYGISAIEKDTAAAPVVFLFEGEGINIVFESLTQMMKTMVASFEAGVFTMGSDGDLATDFFKLGKVAHRLNPSIHYWTQYASYSK
jgi:hypothetical protein